MPGTKGLHFSSRARCASVLGTDSFSVFRFIFCVHSFSACIPKVLKCLTTIALFHLLISWRELPSVESKACYVQGECVRDLSQAQRPRRHWLQVVLSRTGCKHDIGQIQHRFFCSIGIHSVRAVFALTKPTRWSEAEYVSGCIFVLALERKEKNTTRFDALSFLLEEHFNAFHFVNQKCLIDSMFLLWQAGATTPQWSTPNKHHLRSNVPFVLAATIPANRMV